VLRPGDALSDVQTARLAEAVAVLRAKRDALRAGTSPEQVHAQRWVVDLAPADTPDADAASGAA
jgi:hypothetical protein